MSMGEPLPGRRNRKSKKEPDYIILASLQQIAFFLICIAYPVFMSKFYWRDLGVFSFLKHRRVVFGVFIVIHCVIASYIGKKQKVQQQRECIDFPAEQKENSQTKQE